MNLFNRFKLRSAISQAKSQLHQALRLQKRSEDDLYDDILANDKEYLTFSEDYFRLDHAKNCYIIQPYIKWGPKKLHDITPTEQLDEAKALINTLPSWRVEDTVSIPLESMDKRALFGSGSLEKLRQTIRQNGSISAVFINQGTLKKAQILTLEREFGVPILDRYKVVMHILKFHAVSKHAKLQVALAELHYLQKSWFAKGDKEKLKWMFQTREQKLKTAIKNLRSERSLLRSKRQKSEFPVVAVVGYTNAGKTSLIKALTGEDSLRPRNQLFATLDVTLHAGLLPSGLRVLYVDTVGFISDIPTNLIECFVATLEDALLADVILHVEDLASSCFDFKRKHVISTLQNLGAKAGTENIMSKVVSVGNKSDLIPKDREFDVLKVSSTTDVGLDVLRLQLEKTLLANTGRQRLKIRVPAGGEEARWLYKNSTVVSEYPDSENSEVVLADVVITHAKLQQFKHHYVKV